MPLSAMAVSRAKPTEKPYKLRDERGMFLLVTPSGGKYWRFNFRFDGQYRTLALGTYPDVPLADARARREAARKLIADGNAQARDREAVALWETSGRLQTEAACPSNQGRSSPVGL